MTEPIDKDEAYATHLEFLWEQYNKLMGLGVLAAAGTLVFLLQGVLLNNNVREIITKLAIPLNTRWLTFAIVLAGASAIAFVLARWLSQILMERQIYGNRDQAMAYFMKTLGGETILPTALMPKWYFCESVDRLRLLVLVGKANEYAKYAGIILILLSWFFCFAFAWPLIDSLVPVLVKQ